MLACLSTCKVKVLTSKRGIFVLWLELGFGFVVTWGSVGFVDVDLRFRGEKFRQPFGVSEEVALLGDKALCRQGITQMSKMGPKMNFI